MAFIVRGSASEARGLKRGILSDAQEIVSGTKKLSASVDQVKANWKDKGVQKLEGIVEELVQTLTSQASSVNQACEVLEAYAKFLES